jgi:hypothetical protein
VTDRFAWKITIGGVDVSQWVPANGTIDHGRGSVFSGFSAPRAVFDLFTQEGWPTHPGTLPTVEPGGAVVITVTDLEHAAPYEHGRFTGKVQAIEWSEYRLRIIAVGTIADWQHSLAFVPLIGFPVQKDDVRVPAWCAQSDPTQTIIVEGGGGRWLRAIDYGQAPEPLLDVLLAIADDCDALLMQDRFGDVRYRTRYRTPPARETLPSGCIETGSIDMVLEHGTLRNTVYVYYGADPQDYIIETDTDYGSIATYGVRADTLTTQLRLEAGARGKGKTYIEANMNRWQVPDVTMVMALTDDTAYDLLISLEEGDPITLDDLPAGAPISTYDANVIGFTEIMHPTDYQMILHLSQGIEPASEDDGNWVEYGSITGGDDEGTYIDDDGLAWAWHRFTSDGTLTVTDPVLGRLLVAAGGGGGGQADFFAHAGGGGSGAVFHGSMFELTAGDHAVVIGQGGSGDSGATRATQGGTSKFGDVWVYGGGVGGNSVTLGGAAGDGGYGGGGGTNALAGGDGLYGSIDGGVTTNSTVILGGDGEDGGTGDSYGGGNGGGATLVSDITGADVTYAVPGAGSDRYTQPTAYGSGGNGGLRMTAGRDQGQDGVDGVVIVAYRISPGGGDGSYAYDETFAYDSPITYE